MSAFKCRIIRLIIFGKSYFLNKNILFGVVFLYSTEKTHFKPQSKDGKPNEKVVCIGIYAKSVASTVELSKKIRELGMTVSVFIVVGNISENHIESLKQIKDSEVIVVTAGVPIRIPEVTNGERGSNGIEFLFNIIPFSLSKIPASFPVNSSSTLLVSTKTK